MVIGMTRIALHAAAPANGVAGLALALQALSPSEVDGSAEVVRTVVPAPGEGGRLETRDGRVMRVSDPAALAAAINAQDVGVRVDFDHQSEPASPTFRGSTVAEGWARRFRAAADSSIEAALDMSGWASSNKISLDERTRSPHQGRQPREAGAERSDALDAGSRCGRPYRDAIRRVYSRAGIDSGNRFPTSRLNPRFHSRNPRSTSSEITHEGAKGPEPDAICTTAPRSIIPCRRLARWFLKQAGLDRNHQDACPILPSAASISSRIACAASARRGAFRMGRPTTR